MTTEQKELTVWFLTPADAYLTEQLQLVSTTFPSIVTRLMDPNRFDLSVSSDGLDSIVYDGQKIALPHAVVPRVASDYFTLAVVRQFESLGVRVFNSTAAIEIAQDRMYTHQIISAAGLPIPKSVLSRSPFELEYIEQHFGYPVVLKYIASSKDHQWYTFHSRDELNSRMSTLDVNKPMIFQEYDAYQRQYDVRVMVIGKQAVVAQRKDGTPFSLTTHAGITSIATRTAALCHLSFAAIDILVDGKDPATETFRVTRAHFDPDLAAFDALRGTEKPMLIRMMEYIRTECETPLITTGTGSGPYTKLTKQVVPIPIQDDHK